jgi:hypothetical protein
VCPSSLSNAATRFWNDDDDDDDDDLIHNAASLICSLGLSYFIRSVTSKAAFVNASLRCACAAAAAAGGGGVYRRTFFALSSLPAPYSSVTCLPNANSEREQPTACYAAALSLVACAAFCDGGSIHCVRDRGTVLRCRERERYGATRAQRTTRKECAFVARNAGARGSPGW